MSAQPSHQHVTTRLLIAEKSENAAYALDSTLRDAGIATKLSVSDDLAHISQLVSQGEADIALLTDKIDGLDQILPRMRAQAPHVPVVVLTTDEPGNDGDWTVANALSLGATDVVPTSCPDQLTLVVQRELEHICQRRQTSQLRRALSEAEQRCQLLLQGSKAAIAYVHEGMHIHANEGYLNLFGYSSVDDLCGASLIDLLAEDDAATLKQKLKDIRQGADEAVMDFTTRPVDGSDGEPRNMTLTNSQYEGEACLQVTVRSRDAGDAPAAAPAAPAPASQTPLTEAELGLPGFVRAAETQFKHSGDDGFIFCVTLDNFVGMQQAYGLLGAETITRKMWMQLTELTDGAPCVRLGAHQAAVAVAQSRQDAADMAERIRAAISELILEVREKTVRPTVSIAASAYDAELGVGACLDVAYNLLLALAEREVSNVVELPKDAEEEAEENDGARVVLRQITNAIENKMFVLLFQPIISLRGDADEHYEVFLRMTNEQGDQIEPGKFLQTAIDHKIAGKIDRWVILQAIKMLSVHRAKGHTTRLTINLTANSVVDTEFTQWLGVAIKAARLPSDAVIFQITERDATTYLRQTREFLEQLRGMHCRASLSRFGLVEDPFETLRHLPVDMVKVDGSFIDAIDKDNDARDSFMDTLNRLQGSGKLTVVPMVENAGTLSMLWQAGVNYIQGHYLQEPMTEMDYDFSTEE